MKQNNKLNLKNMSNKKYHEQLFKADCQYVCMHVVCSLKLLYCYLTLKILKQ